MEHLDIRVDTLRDILLYTFGIYTSICRREDFFPLRTNAPDPEIFKFLVHSDGPDRLLPDGSRNYAERLQYYYSNDAGMFWGFCVSGESIYLLGPAFTASASMPDVLGSTKYRGLSPGQKKALTDFSRRLPLLSAHRMYLCGLMLHSCLTGTSSSMQDLVILGAQDIPEPQASSRDRTTDRLMEQKIWSVIRDGNLNYRQDLESITSTIMVGNISGGKYLRQEQNQAIITASLGCRAAIEGGLNPNVAYNLSDRFIQRAEACSSLGDVTELSMEIMDTYIRLVHEARQTEGISAQVRDCRDHISLHPEENPDISQLAARYGYTPYYFSKKFKQETGLTLRAFVTQKKVERAKELLTSTPLSTADISELLGFNSQSYFGSVFKAATGITPGAYRQRGGRDSKEETV